MFCCLLPDLHYISLQGTMSLIDRLEPNICNTTSCLICCLCVQVTSQSVAQCIMGASNCYTGAWEVTSNPWDVDSFMAIFTPVMRDSWHHVWNCTHKMLTYIEVDRRADYITTPGHICSIERRHWLYINLHNDLSILVSWLCTDIFYYSDVIVSAMASRITGVSMVCWTFVQVQIKGNIKGPRHWPLWGEFTGDRCIPLKTQKMFPVDDVIMHSSYNSARAICALFMFCYILLWLSAGWLSPCYWGYFHWYWAILCLSLCSVKQPWSIWVNFLLGSVKNWWYNDNKTMHDKNVCMTQCIYCI